MARFLLKRVALSVITLWLLSVIVFTAGQVLPGNVGRAMLGPFADQRAVTRQDQADVESEQPLERFEIVGHVAVGRMNDRCAVAENVVAAE